MTLNTSALGKDYQAHLTKADTKKLKVIVDGLEERYRLSIMHVRFLATELRLTIDRSYSINDNENELGVLSAGGLISTVKAGPIAAASVSGPEFRMRGRIKKIGPWVRQMMQRIANELDFVASSTT